MRLASAPVISRSEFLPILYQDCTNRGIWTGQPHSLAAAIESTAHPVFIVHKIGLAWASLKGKDGRSRTDNMSVGWE